MKKIVLMLLVAMVFASCSRKIYSSLQWQSNKVVADGKIPEWDNPLRFYDYKSKINYTISNDNKNLYLCFKVSDETEKMKILHSGVEFRIDTTGKKSYPIIFTYPLPNEQMQMQHGKRGENQADASSGERQNRSYMLQKRLSLAKDVQLVGFKPPLDGIVISGTSGIYVAINIDSSGVMFCESIIPFGTFYKNELEPVDSNRVFGFELIVNAFEAPTHEGGEEGGGGGMQGGGGMSGGGMHGGGGGGMHGGHGSMESGAMSESNKIKNTLKLAFKL
jgi:hypothetical protein